MNKGQEQKRVEINEENPEALLAVYGTLRPGHGNYMAILEGRAELLGTYRTEPIFTLSGKNSGFPILLTGGKTAVEYDLFRVTDPRVLERCHNLEGCTGIPGDERNWYDIMKLTNEEHGDFHIYVQHHKCDEESIIESGNWLTRHESI